MQKTILALSVDNMFDPIDKPILTRQVSFRDDQTHTYSWHQRLADNKFHKLCVVYQLHQPVQYYIDGTLVEPPEEKSSICKWFDGTFFKNCKDTSATINSYLRGLK